MGWKAEAYHGLLDQVERAAIMKRFKSKQVDFLVATDLAARGLDVEGLPTVVNYAFPEDIEIYIHRCGRTGRAGRKGAVYNLVASKKEEILVQSFHEELEIALKGFMIQPMDKNAHRSVEGKLVKAHLNRGKRDNIAAGDIVGFLVNSTGVKADAVGTIAIYAGYALVDMPEWALEVLEMNEDPKLKGKSVKVTQYSLNDQKHRAAALKKSQVGVADKKKLEQRKAIVRAPRSSPEQREGKVAPEPNESVQGGKTGSMRRTKEKAEKGQPEGGKRASGPSSPAARKADPKAKPKPNPRKAKSPVPSKPKPTEAKASGSKKRPSSPRTVKGGKHA
jgi:superfamily II DNA/RNA helicase